MNRFVALVLLASLAFAHLPPTPASLRRSAAHKKRLDGPYLPSTAVLHRRLEIGVDALGLSDTVQILGQSSDGTVSATLNGVTTTFPPDTVESPSSSDTPSTSSGSPEPTPPPPSSSPATPSTSNSAPSPPESSPSSPSDPASSSSTPNPTPSLDSSPNDCLLGLLCLTSSSQTPSSTEVPPPSSANDPPQTSSPLPQESQPPSTTNASPSDPVDDGCGLLGCLLSSTPVSSNTIPTPPPPASSDPTTTRPPPENTSPVATQPPSSSSTDNHCLLLGLPLGCILPSTPVSSNTVSTQPPPANSDLTVSQPSPASSNPVATHPPHPSTPGDLCLQFNIGCPPSSTPSAGSDPVSTPLPSNSSNPVGTAHLPTSTPGDLCLIAGIGCPLSSTSANSDPVSSLSRPVSTAFPTLSIISEPPGSTLFSSSEPPLTTGLSSLPSGSTSVSSATPIIFPSEISGLSSSSTPNSPSMTSSPTSAPVPTNTQFQWLTQTSLIFSSFSKSASDSQSLTDPDQVPTSTSFSNAGAPSVAPSVAPLPSGLPARIVPGDGGANPEVDNLNGYTLIAMLFDRALGWTTVVSSPDSPGQIFSWLPVIIQTALGITGDQVKSYALEVYIPASYQNTSDVAQLGTLWMGYIPTDTVETLAAQIKVLSSNFYRALPTPYSELASHVDASFDITTVTTTTGIPGSSGSNSDSSGVTSDDSRTRENAIIGVVSALGGITLIVLGYLIYRTIQKRRELAHRRLSDPPANAFTGEAPPNRNFDQDSIGGQRRRSFYFAEDSLRGFSDHSYTNDGARLSPEQISGLNRRPIAGNIGPPVMRENSLNF